MNGKVDAGELAPALAGDWTRLASSVGGLSLYRSGPTEGRPVLLIHSVNAAASAYETRPLYERFARERPTYAIELPGFGRSERADRIYTPRVMSDAIRAALDHIGAARAPDCVAISLSCEFLAEVAAERGDAINAIGLVSPTGFDRRLWGEGKGDGNLGKDWLLAMLRQPLWRRGLFDALTSRASMRFFLEKTWGSKRIDEGLLDYGYASAHRRDAEFAPLCFISGFLFPASGKRLYEAVRRNVWVAHGVRGDFVDYRHLPEIAARAGWRVEVFEAGAMPHFEHPDAVHASLAAFFSAPRA